MQRDLIEVINQMIVFIPENEMIINRLEWIKNHASYQPPELMRESFNLVTYCFMEFFPANRDDNNAWQKQVIKIWLNE